MQKPKILALVILDGFGISLQKVGNPVMEAHTQTFDFFERNFPFTTLQASGVAVGLPWGESGNSEVGHFTMGSGKVIYHHLPRIINAIHDNSFFKNEAFLAAVQHVREQKSHLHIVGLTSSGSVHSYIDHVYALFDFVRREDVSSVYLHVFTDGKDAPPKEGVNFLSMLENRIQKENPNVHIASVVGRFYGMDRDEKWERIRAAYELLTEGTGARIASVAEYIRLQYEKGLSDEFIEPAHVSIQGAENPNAGVIQDNDAVIFFNFREDSMREITHAFTDEAYDHFPRRKLQNLFVVTMTQYEKNLLVTPAFPQSDINWPLSRILGEAGLRHLHIAETQKYAHITYFFNGGRETPFPGEERILVPSVNTAHFNEVPQMRTPEITQKIIENIPTHDVIIANFANADMVGHTGDFDAAIKAVEVIDQALGEIVKAIFEEDGVLIITADHGNIELKRNILTGEKLTEHSTNPIPFYLVAKQWQRKTPLTGEEVEQQKKNVGGILTDVAPTIIEILGLKQPLEMTGNSLLPLLLKEEKK